MYIKYDKRPLKIGDKIRLAGREGVIDDVGEHDDDLPHGVKFELSYPFQHWLNLADFPSAELWVEEPRISKEAAAELKKSVRLETFSLVADYAEYEVINAKSFLDKIDSMTE